MAWRYTLKILPISKSKIIPIPNLFNKMYLLEMSSKNNRNLSLNFKSKHQSCLLTLLLKVLLKISQLISLLLLKKLFSKLLKKNKDLKRWLLLSRDVSKIGTTPNSLNFGDSTLSNSKAILASQSSAHSTSIDRTMLTSSLTYSWVYPKNKTTKNGSKERKNQ